MARSAFDLADKSMNGEHIFMTKLFLVVGHMIFIRSIITVMDIYNKDVTETVFRHYVGKDILQVSLNASITRKI